MKIKIEHKIALEMSADGASFERVHSNLIKVADEYAIGFAEWYLKISEKYDSYLKLKNDTKELLEIYKKEKGL